MCERLLGRHVLELGARATAEGASRAGEHEGVDLLRLASLEALEERGVLAVDRQDPAPPPLACGESELSGGDEALLVREREIDPRSSAQSVAWTPAKPTTALRTTSGCARSSSSVRSPPTSFSGASTSSSGVEPEAAAQSSSSGCASTISIA
jgi:hypothetical protein